MTARGLAWELTLEQRHREYRRDRRAVIFRCHPRRDRSGKYLEDAPPDFLGALADGRAVALEAKDHAGARWPLSRLADHQARDLEAVHLAGGVAGVALRLGGSGWWLGWGDLRGPWQAWRGGERGPASVDGAWLREHAWPIVDGDWLTAVAGGAGWAATLDRARSMPTVPPPAELGVSCPACGSGPGLECRRGPDPATCPAGRFHPARSTP